MLNKWFRLLEEAVKLPKPPTEIDLVITKIKSINVAQYKGAYSSDYSLKQVNVYVPTITSYNKLLQTLIKLLEADEQISRLILPGEVSLVYLRDFLIDDKGHFIDIEDQLTDFLRSIEILLTTFQEREQSIDKSFNTEKNLLLLQHIVSNLCCLVTESL